MTAFSHDSAFRPDYFTYIPAGPNLNHHHFSSETPLFSPTFSHQECETPSDPNHPLLAYRLLPDSPTAPNGVRTMSGNLLQLQTNAAHSSSSSSSSSSPPTRPPARRTQNVLHVTSDDGSESSGSDSSSHDVRPSPCEYARCSRCQRTPSIDIRTGQWNMIQYGLNLWYCSRCAALVGMTQR